MRLCYLCNEYPPSKHGGIGSITQTLSRTLVSRGHDISVMGVYPIARRIEEDDHGVRVIRLPHTRIPKTGFLVNSARLAFELRRQNETGKTDILEGPESAFGILPSSKQIAKIIRMNGGHHFFATELGGRPQAWRSFLESRSFAEADFLCAVSHYVAESTRSIMGLKSRPIAVLNNPVDTTLFRPWESSLEQDGLIVFVGTVCEKKGVRELVQAMPHVWRRVPGARLWLVGRDWQDSVTKRVFSQELRQYIPADHASQIRFVGPVQHELVPEILSRAAVCVFPSYMEAFPVAWLEALAMGKAVIGSNTGPGPEVIEDGITGLLCDPHNPTAIAECLTRLLQDKQLRNALGSRAHQAAVANFSVSILVTRNENFYQQCLDAGHGA